jgi:hypothetical protein
MEESATTGELITSLVYLIAGVRLVRMSRLTREIPERLLGASFLFMGAGSLFYSVAIISSFEALWTQFNFSARISYVIGFILVAFFTQRVFRPEERWGRWLVYGTVALFIAGVGGSAMSGDWEGFSTSSGWYWLEWVGYQVPVTWTCVEATAEHIRARRRQQVGLCEPLVCNRLLLWACFGALQACGNVITVGQYVAFEQTQVFTAGWDYFYSAASISALVMMWIAFFPPAYYKRWLDRANPTHTVEQG